MMTRLLDVRPPRIAQFLTLLALTVHLATPLQDQRVFASMTLAVGIGLTGLLIMLRAWWLFRQAGTAICPAAETTRLITSDVYRLTRNPMYLGIVMIMLGLALVVGSLPFYLAAAAYFLIMDRAFVPREERKLTTAFGDEYHRYRARTRRWL